MSDSGDLSGPQSGASASAATLDQPDPSCAVAHGHAPIPVSVRTLAAVFDSPVARFLLSYARDTNFRAVLVEPDPTRAKAAADALAATGAFAAARDGSAGAAPAGIAVVTEFDSLVGGDADVVVTDHHRPELGLMLRDALASPARWIGVMGNPRHPGPHIEALTALGVPPGEIARVHRPIGLNIGSRTPAEIALSTMAGLIADRNQRDGGFHF